MSTSTSSLSTVDPDKEEAELAAAPLIDAETDSIPAPLPVTPTSSAGTILLALSLLLVALNQRPTVTSIGPVLPEIVRSNGISAFGASALTTLPVLCFGLIGPFAPGLARRLGAERTILVVLGILAAGAALRGLPAVPALFGGQLLASCAIGIMNVLLPGLVKRDFPNRLALMTGLYTMALCTGGAVAAGAMVPLTRAFGDSWMHALAFWAIPAMATGLFWAGQLPPQKRSAAHTAHRVTGLWSDPLAWQVTLFMGLQSALAFTVFGWFAPILRDRGLNPVDAGLALSISVFVQAVAALFAPVLATRGKDQRLICVTALALCIAGFLGCIYGPLWSLWIWAVVLGIAQGSLFALALTLIVLRAPNSHVASHLSGMSQGVGYVLASGGPMLTGILYSWAESWTPVAILFVGISLGAALCAIGAGRALHVRATSVPLSE